MTVEDVLIELGADKIKESKHSQMLMMYLNAYLPAKAKVQPEMTGQEALSQIYTLSDSALRETVLQKKVGLGVRTRDSYRTTVLLISAFLGMTTIASAWAAMTSGDATAWELIGEIGRRVLTFIQISLGV